nr:MAG TPA: hypothetical protein [Bacteriophage sp.]
MASTIAQIAHPARYVDAGFRLNCLCRKLTIIAQNAHPHRKRSVLIIGFISRTEGGLTVCKVNLFTGGARANNP